MEEKETKGLSFFQTKTGKFLKVIDIIGVILGVIGLGVAIFEFVLYIRNIDTTPYETILHVGDSFLTASMICIFGTSLIVLENNSNEKRKKEKEIATKKEETKTNE